MDVFHNEDFIFNCPYSFSDRYAGGEDFFKVGQKRYELGMQHIWETNFIMDIEAAALDERAVKGAGVRITQFELSGNSLSGHLAQWPAGRDPKPPYHLPRPLPSGFPPPSYLSL